MRITKKNVIRYLGRYVCAKFELFPEGKRIFLSALVRRRGRLQAVLTLSAAHTFRVPWNEVRLESMTRR